MMCPMTSARAKSISCLTGAGSDQEFPSYVSRKFDASGAVLPFPGNTFICHVPPGSVAHGALTEASRALQAGSVAAAFSFLPPSSFHMTVFEGVCDADRNGDADRWPSGIRRDAPLSEINQTFQNACEAVPIQKQQQVRPTGIFGGFSVSLNGHSPLAEASLRHTRRLLRDATGIYRADFNAYSFHITLAYPLRWLTPVEANSAMDLSGQVFDQLVMQVSHIALGPVEFCTFKHMQAFDPQFVFSGRADIKFHNVSKNLAWNRSLPCR